MEKLRLLAYNAGKITHSTGRAIEELSAIDEKTVFEFAVKALTKLMNPNASTDQLQQIEQRTAEQGYQSIYDAIPHDISKKRKEKPN